MDSDVLDYSEGTNRFSDRPLEIVAAQIESNQALHIPELAREPAFEIVRREVQMAKVLEATDGRRQGFRELITTQIQQLELV